jgi:hypothetical protein
MGEMRRAIDREERERHKADRFASTLVIAASIIAVVRLAPATLISAHRVQGYPLVSFPQTTHRE